MTIQKFELQVLWLEDSIGFAINQTIYKQSIPLTNYYFWPVNDCWEQVKLDLKSKGSISELSKIGLLNRISDILNSWKQQRIKMLEAPLLDSVPIVGVDTLTIVGLP